MGRRMNKFRAPGPKIQGQQENIGKGHPLELRYFFVFVYAVRLAICAYRPLKKATTTSQKKASPPKADASTHRT